MNTIMFRLKAIPLAASSSVPIRPTITMKTAKAPTSSEYCRPVGIPKRTRRADERTARAASPRACP